MKRRSAGVLLHITSLPSPYGIGDFGPSALEFARSLKTAGQTYWQILPLTITNNMTGNSPYSSPSAFAINPILVSPDELLNGGFLSKKDLGDFRTEEDSQVDYGAVEVYKSGLLDAAYQKFSSVKSKHKDFDAFCAEQKHWLDGYAAFEVIRREQGFKVWSEWPQDLRKFSPEVVESVRKTHPDRYRYFCFVQFVLYSQWEKLKRVVNGLGVEFIGDIPIYVEYDSADAWQDPDLFKLDENGKQYVVAGVPPDYFSKTGQRWGNPLYNWKKMRENKYEWWIRRLRHVLALYDIVRIDHFRGLVQYWEVPVSEPTAINGRWRYVPTRSFFPTILAAVGKERLIAEDLGIITDDVKALMARYGLPGMKILMFAFGEDLKDHPYLPHNFDTEAIVYTGTHDNNTLFGWYNNDAQPHEKMNLSKYLNKAIDEDSLHWDLIELAYNSPAKCAIIPVQDFIGLDGGARMNTPGTVDNNWCWRMSFDDWDEEILAAAAELARESGRAPTTA